MPNGEESISGKASTRYMKTRVDLEIVAGRHRGLAKALEMARSDERRGESLKGVG